MQPLGYALLRGAAAASASILWMAYMKYRLSVN